MQGNILRAYGRTYRCVRHLVLRVVDAAAARAALGAMLNGDRSTPEVTPGDVDPSEAGLPWCLNVGVTAQGLVALGVPDGLVATFPPEFREGMAARAARLGDLGNGAPQHWRGGLGRADRVHLIVTIHGRGSIAEIEPISEQVLGAQGGRAFEASSPVPFDGNAIEQDGRRLLHFGYADGISQPSLEGVHPEPGPGPGTRRATPLGAVLLGHPTALPHVVWRTPQPDELGGNGSFNAFRVLRQDVRAFENFLQATACELVSRGALESCTPDLVAAKLCGRWRNGAPLTLAPDQESADAFVREQRDLDDFDYPADDADGTRCPVGSHIRRANPRGGQIVQRAANRTRTIVRRGMPYGPPYDHSKPDDEPRGLLGNFICASLAAQFEAVQYDWLNLGLQHPAITGTNDPLVGANEPSTSSFLWPVAGANPIVVRGIPKFVTTEGGAYCFLPSISALRWIAGARWDTASG